MEGGRKMGRRTKKGVLLQSNGVIRGTAEPGGLPSMGLHRVGHD